MSILKNDYGSINPHNLCPIFTQEQLALSLHTTFFSVPALHATIIMDIEKLCSDIHSSLCSDPITSAQLDSLSPCWSVDSEGFLLLNDKIYIPNTSDLQLHILQYKHNHPISGHFRQNLTMELVRREYIWLKVYDSIKSYVKSCTTCMSQRHCPYGLLKQLPIPERPWNSISMDFIEKLPMSDSSDMILVIIDQAVNLYPNHWHHHIPHASQAVHPPCFLQAWCSLIYNLRPWHGVHLHLLPLTQ